MCVSLSFILSICTVLPRVHQILTHLCYAPVQNQCVSILSQSSDGTKNESNVIADEIATTTSMLLHKLDDHSIHTILEDMINLLSDLSTIATSNMMEQHENDDLQIRIFTKTIEMLQKKNSDNGTFNEEQTMLLDVTSKETLLMLQTAVQKSFFALLLFEYQKRTEEDPNTPDLSSTKDDYYSLSPSNISTSLLSDSIDHDMKNILMTSMCQMLLSPMEQSSSCSSDIETFKILAMRNKVTAVFFLSHVFGDFIVTCPEKFGHIGLRVELTSLVLQSILSHLTQQHETCIDFDDNVDLANLVESDKCYAVCEHYSSLLTNLLRDVVVCPPYKNQKSGQHNIDFRILLDCLPIMPEILRTNADIFTSTKRLCRMVLRAIHVTLHDTSNNSYSQEKDEEKKKNIQSLQRYARIHCSSKKLFPYLFDLMMDLKVMNVAISIIAVLFNDEYCTNILNRACQMHEEQWKEEEHCSTQEKDVIDEANVNDHPENDKVYSHIPKRQRIAKMLSERSNQTNQSFLPQLQIKDASRNSQESTVSLEDFHEVVDIKDNESTECSNDSSLSLCLLHVLEKALYSAKQVVHHEAEFQANNNEKNLKRSINIKISSESVKTICCTVRILELGMTKEIFSDSEAFRIIRKYTWKALFLISESLRNTYSEATKVGEESNRIMESLLGVGFHVVPDPKGQYNEDWKDKTLNSISKYALKYWRILCGELHHHQPKDLDHSLLGNHNSVPRIHPSYTELSFLTQDQEKILRAYQKQYHHHCVGRCKSLSCRFGAKFPNFNSQAVQSNCLCSLISSHGSTDRMRVDRYFSTCTKTMYEDKFIDDCTSFLLKDILPLSER